MATKLVLHSSLFALALGHDFCTMAEHDGACTSCGTCPFANSNFGCSAYGVLHHAETYSVKKCLSQDASCGGSQERCYGTTYECEPGYVRPDGSSEYSVTCKNGALDYGPACVRRINCYTEDTATAEVVGGPSTLEENESATYECKAGWINAVGPTPVSSFSATCVRRVAMPDSDTGVLSPDPASKCAIKPGCTKATMSNFDAEATMDDGSCAECFDDSHCPTQSKPVCNSAVGVCVQCTTQLHCSADTSQSCDMASNTCQCAIAYTGTPGPGGVCVKPGCTNAIMSNFDAEATMDDGSCVECSNNGHCPVGKPVCHSVDAVCVECQQQTDCSADASQTCDALSSTCRCSPGYTGSTGANGVCSPEPDANIEETANVLSLWVVAALIGLLLCFFLLCFFLCRHKRRRQTGEDRENESRMIDSAAMNRSSGSHKRHHERSQRSTRSRGVE